MRAYTRSLSSFCALEEYGPHRYGDRDCIGSVNGQWFAFLTCGYTHGPLPTRADAINCSEGRCDCWKRRGADADKRHALILTLNRAEG